MSRRAACSARGARWLPPASALRAGDKRGKQSARRILLRVPQHAEREIPVGHLDRLDEIVLERPPGRDQPVAELGHPLVVVRLYGQQLGAGRAGRQGARLEADAVLRESAGGRLVAFVAQLVGEVLNERSSSRD